MSYEDEPLEMFYPRCCVCGDQITGDGYKFGDQYCCENCAETIDGSEEADDIRYGAWLNAQKGNR